MTAEHLSTVLGGTSCRGRSVKGCTALQGTILTRTLQAIATRLLRFHSLKCGCAALLRENLHFIRYGTIGLQPYVEGRHESHGWIRAGPRGADELRRNRLEESSPKQGSLTNGLGPKRDYRLIRRAQNDALLPYRPSSFMLRPDVMSARAEGP
eukprot:3360574-Pleurochrysis_carterae.AAC.2